MTTAYSMNHMEYRMGSVNMLYGICKYAIFGEKNAEFVKVQLMIR